MYTKSKKAHGKGWSVIKFLSTWDFSNLVKMNKGKLEAKYGMAYTNPFPEPWKISSVKGQKEGNSERTGLRIPFTI